MEEIFYYTWLSLWVQSHCLLHLFLTKTIPKCLIFLWHKILVFLCGRHLITHSYQPLRFLHSKKLKTSVLKGQRDMHSQDLLTERVTLKVSSSWIERSRMDGVSSFSGSSDFAFLAFSVPSFQEYILLLLLLIFHKQVNHFMSKQLITFSWCVLRVIYSNLH